MGGELIPVSSLNDSDKAKLLSVVAKKKRFWWWQKPKYNFSSCACLLGDVLMDDKPVKPGKVHLRRCLQQSQRIISIVRLVYPVGAGTFVLPL